MANSNDEPINPAQQNDATVGREEETLRGMDDLGGIDEEEDEFDAEDLDDEEEEDEEGGGGF